MSAPLPRGGLVRSFTATRALPPSAGSPSVRQVARRQVGACAGHPRHDAQGDGGGGVVVVIVVGGGNGGVGCVVGGGSGGVLRGG